MKGGLKRANTLVQNQLGKIDRLTPPSTPVAPVGPKHKRLFTPLTGYTEEGQSGETPAETDPIRSNRTDTDDQQSGTEPTGISATNVL